jgi:hypothetical protein
VHPSRFSDRRARQAARYAPNAQTCDCICFGVHAWQRAAVVPLQALVQTFMRVPQACGVMKVCAALV